MMIINKNIKKKEFSYTEMNINEDCLESYRFSFVLRWVLILSLVKKSALNKNVIAVGVL